MAKEPPAKPAAEPQEPAKKGLPIKTIGIVAVLLVAEAAAMFFLLGATGKPKETEAALVDAQGAGKPDKGALVELNVVKERFPNNSTGRPWIWDAEIVVQVKGSEGERIQGVLESRAAEIRTGIGRIWRTAQQAHFNEPGLETLTRQVTAFLDELLGPDAEGHSQLKRVLVARCVGFPTDY